MEGSARDKQGPEGGSVAGVLGPARPLFLWRGQISPVVVITAVVHLAMLDHAFPDENFPGKSWLVGRGLLEGK